MEGDVYHNMVDLHQRISIHSLRMEGDLDKIPVLTHPCISIHSLRMEGDYIDLVDGDPAIIISIHSLRMEGDQGVLLVQHSEDTFQSTPSAWRETQTMF